MSVIKKYKGNQTNNELIIRISLISLWNMNRYEKSQSNSSGGEWIMKIRLWYEHKQKQRYKGK